MEDKKIDTDGFCLPELTHTHAAKTATHTCADVVNEVSVFENTE